MIVYVWTNKFMHSVAKKEVGAIIRANATIGTNMVRVNLCNGNCPKPHKIKHWIFKIVLSE